MEKKAHAIREQKVQIRMPIRAVWSEYSLFGDITTVSIDFV